MVMTQEAILAEVLKLSPVERKELAVMILRQMPKEHLTEQNKAFLAQWEAEHGGSET